MKIYLDYIFLENLVVNTVVIIEIILFTNLNISKRKRNLFIFIDTILSCVINLVPQMNNYVFHFIFTTITLTIIYNFKSIYEYMKTVACYYLIYFNYIGIIIVFSIVFNIPLENIIFKLITYIVSGIFLHLLINDLWKVWKSKMNIRDLYYILKIDDVEIKSFVDTGNTVKEPISNLNVIFIKDELKEKIELDKYKKISVYVLTVNGIDEKEGYVVENITVIKDKKEIAKIPKIILCFSLTCDTPEKYSALIGYDTYLENLNGGVGY